MDLLKEYYRFIRDDVRLGAIVYPNGRQILKMEYFNTETGDIIHQEQIDCIHTAVHEISFEEIEDNKDNEDFVIDILKTRSMEGLKVINLEINEKFKAFKSWVAGIAEAGMDSFQIQTEIESLNNFIYPITDKLLYFMVCIDSDFIPMYLLKMEKEAMHEGIRHIPFILSKFLPLFSMIFSDLVYNQGLSNNGKNVLAMLLEAKPPDELFLKNPSYAILLIYDWKFYRELCKRHPILIDLVTAQMISYGLNNEYGGFSIFATEEQNPMNVFLNEFIINLDINDINQKKLIIKHLLSFRQRLLDLKENIRFDKFMLAYSILRNWGISNLNFSIDQ